MFNGSCLISANHSIIFLFAILVIFLLNRKNSSVKRFSYELPEVRVHKGDGRLAFVNEKNQLDWLNGGRQLYIPIWIKALQKYPIDFMSTDEIDINAVNFDSKAYVDVYAYMYEASESKTVQQDEVMLKPEMQK